MFSGLFPEKGNMITMSLIKELSDKIKLSAKDIDDIKLTVEEGNYKWDKKKATDLKINLSDTEVNFLKELISKKDKEETITQDQYELYLKINNIKT